MAAYWVFKSPPGSRGFVAQAGYTVIEILVALVLVSIVLGMAMPSLQQMSANNQVVSASNSIVSGLNFARFNAITTGDDITICPSASGTACNEGQWGSNWIVFNDADSDSVPDADEILRVAALDSTVDISGFTDSIVFRSDGVTALGSNATISSCYPQTNITDKCIDIVVNTFGAIESSTRHIVEVTE